jgi:excisionase family DNA binding protein
VTANLQDAPASAEPIALRINDAARVSGLGRTKLYELMGAGDLPSVKVGGRRLILRADLARLFTAAKEAA